MRLVSSKKGVEVLTAVQGQREGFCKQCHGKDDKPWYRHDPMRAVYVRLPGKGFVRIGWLFEGCSHLELEKSWLELRELKKLEKNSGRLGGIK